LADRAEDTSLSATTAGDGSKGTVALPARARALARQDPIAAALLVATLLAALALALVEVLPVAKVVLAGGSCEVINDADPALADRCVVSGFEQHGGAFLLLAATAAAMGFGALVGRSRPAGAALVVLGLAALVVVLAIDLPQARSSGAIGANYESAEGRAAVGFWVELVAAVSLATCGVLALRWAGERGRLAPTARQDRPARPSAQGQRPAPEREGSNG